MNMFVLHFGKVTYDINEKRKCSGVHDAYFPFVSQPFKKHCFATNSYFCMVFEKTNNTVDLTFPHVHVKCLNIRKEELCFIEHLTFKIKEFNIFMRI